jgi:hypothetical protein
MHTLDLVIATPFNDRKITILVLVRAADALFQSNISVVNPLYSLTLLEWKLCQLSPRAGMDSDHTTRLCVLTGGGSSWVRVR